MSVGDHIVRVCRATNRLLAKRVATASDHSYLQLRALWIIEQEGVRTQVALAERLFIDAPSASRLVDRLEKDGLLTRKEGDDRRSVCLTLTAAGRKEVRAIVDALASFEGDVERHLTRQEAKTLEALLQKLHAGLEGPTAD